MPKSESNFDDIIVHDSTKKECSSNLIACLKELQKNDLHLDPRKYSFFNSASNFCVECNRTLKSPAKTKTIIDMPRPKSVDDVCRFLGMVTYYSRFIPNASTRTAPMQKILKKDTRFKWTA